MKTTNFILSKLQVILLLLVIINGCKKDDLTSIIEGLPIVKTSGSDSSGLNTQKIICEVINEGDAVVTERGFVWTDDESSLPPTVNSRIVKCGAGVGEYECLIENLNPGIKYYVRAYAKNSKGISYGQTISFEKNFIPGMNYPKEGGILAYVFEPLDSLFQQGIIRGIIMADTILGPSTWGCQGTLIGTSLNLGTGSINTLNVSNTCTAMINASSLCSSLVHSGKSDWFLPSKAEIVKVISKLPLHSACSSSENDAITFWAYAVPMWFTPSKSSELQPFDLQIRPFRFF